MKYNEIDIKKGIKLHTIKTEKFKTNLIAVMLTTKLDRKNITKNALIPAVLRRGTKFMQTQEEIIKRFYNAIFVTQYSGSKYHTVLGQFEFSKESKIFAINAANMMSNFAEFS